MTGLDYAIVVAFLSIMALAGVACSRLIRDADDFFVAARELTPFILCATLTATNLSLFHFIGMGGIAYKSGVSIIWQNWAGDMALVLSGLIIVPVMRRLRLRSIPEFLELRYSRWLRILIGGFWGLRLCVFLGILLYLAATAGIVISGSENTATNYVYWLLIFSAVSIAYSTVGGAWAIAIMDSVQFVVMLAGAIIVLPIAMYAVGGLPSLLAWFHSSGQAEHIQLVPTTGEFNWVFILAITGLAIKYCSVDQALLQRAFGARTPRIAAKAMVYSGIITTPLALFWILPGLAIVKLNPNIANPDHAVPWLLSTYVPMYGRGLLGLVLCGLVAAQISTITADVNSVATLFTSDVYRKLLKREPSQRQLLNVVRIASLLCGVLMLVTAYGLRFTNAGAVRANLAVVGIVDMPLFVITIIYGLFWKRANWQGATAGFIGGGVVGISCYLLITPDLFHAYVRPVFNAVSSALADRATGWHESIRWLKPWLLSIAPIASSTTALVLTPAFSLLTPSRQTQGAAVINASFVGSNPSSGERAGADAELASGDVTGERDTFDLIPRSALGRSALGVVFLGFAVFLASVLSAIVASPVAMPGAVVGMLLVFAGGLVRVHVE